MGLTLNVSIKSIYCLSYNKVSGNQFTISTFLLYVDYSRRLQTRHKLIYWLLKQSRVPWMRFESADFRIVASIPSNCEPTFLPSSKLPNYTRNVSTTVVATAGVTAHGSIGIRGTISGTITIETLSLSWAIVVTSMATMLSSAKTKSMLSRQGGTRSNLLVDTTHGNAPQRQLQNVPNIQHAFCDSPHVTNNATSIVMQWR